MSHYNLSIANPEKHFLNIEATFRTEGRPILILKFPCWRPGRYELVNFAKNVKGFKVETTSGKPLHYAKRGKDEWMVHTDAAAEIVVTYQYYSNELNAGSTYLDENQLYVNPVNCFIHEENQEDKPCTLTLEIPDTYKVAGSLEAIGANKFKAASYHELVDSPFIASDSLQHNSFDSHGITFHIWFQGEVKPDWNRLITDYKKYTDYQIEKFESFPVDEYHYLIQIGTTKVYHGVEHQKSTVLQLGPSYEVFESLYTELLGVSSHELYHTWNVKAIRPDDMFPYKYDRENYSELGYVAEGVTTYMGDRILYECGVFDSRQYHKELGSYVNRHFHNDGRFNYSVAESSIDTWLDGYVMGIPGRKTSIYTEGCLIAYISDMRIRAATNNERSLHTVMQKLYDLTNQKMGYTEELYRGFLESESGLSFHDIFDDLVHGTASFIPYLDSALAFDGRKLSSSESKTETSRYGLKGVNKGDGYDVKLVLQNSSASDSGVVAGDLVIGVNGILLAKDLDKWLNYFKGEPIKLLINRSGKQVRRELTVPNDNQYYAWVIEEL